MSNSHSIPDYLNRSSRLLTEPGIERLRQSRIAIAGCGGVGAAHAISTARLGVGGFHLADPGVFDEPDINRQWGAYRSTMGERKIDVYERMLKDVSPSIETTLFGSGVTWDNLDEFLDGIDLLVDCLDVSVPLELREELHRRAHSRKIFTMTAPIIGYGCVVACSDPGGLSMELFMRLFRHTEERAEFPPLLREVFMPQHLDLVAQSIELGRVPSLSISPLIATALLATETVNFLLGDVLPEARRPIALPQVMFFDLFRLSYRIVDAGAVLRNTEGH